ncbi:MAG: DUF4349 domain-containing protein [Chloroflexia bacterium]|nr:DUF4349 domain-containing protein [Chloroflexia bacterium]
MRPPIFITMLIIMFALAGCGGQTVSSEFETINESLIVGSADSGAPMGMPPTAAERGMADEATAQEVGAPLPSGERLVIKNGSLSLQVEQVSEVEAQIRTLAEQQGGYIVSISTSGSDENLSSSITLRVPENRFDETLTAIEGLALKIFSRSVSGDDVTEEFVDLESRLRTLEATQERLLELLTRAEDVEAALQVNYALRDIQSEIEQIMGRMKYLQQSAAMSTLFVDLRPVPPPPTIVEEGQWQPLRVAQTALRDLVIFGQGLLNFGIVLIIWSPLWLPLLLIVRWGWGRLRSRERKAPAAKATAGTPTGKAE